MKNAIITKLEEMLGSADISAVAHQMRALQKEYQTLWTSEFETAKQEFVDGGGKAKEFEYAKHPDDVTISKLFDKIEAKKKEDDAKYEAEDSNAVTEKEIVNLIKAFSEIKSLQSRKKITELVKTMS